MPDLLLKPTGTRGKVHEVTPANAGWGYVGFTLYRLEAGDVAEEATGDEEVILVIVEGKAQVQAAGQDWGEMGDRMDVFEKTPPHCLYVPNGSQWKATATTPCTIGVCKAPGKGNYPARRLGPDGITLTPRGKGTNTRHVNNIAMEALDVADSLLVTEVFTPAGNWSSYPSHRHDEDDFQCAFSSPMTTASTRRDWRSLRIAAESPDPEGEVWTVAPAFEQSGVAHCISYTHPMMIAEMAPRRFAAEGTPGRLRAGRHRRRDEGAIRPIWCCRA
jgi:hypothetical protein